MLNSLSYPKTNDSSIRTALKKVLTRDHKDEKRTIIIEELGLKHGASRIDIAVVNGIIHGYELKSDLDTLKRLPDQMRIYNSVLDQITLVVGKNHLHEAIKIIPEWWGVVIAKTVDSEGTIDFCNIRESDENPLKDNYSIAKLLWREEALGILEEIDEVRGIRSRPRDILYKKLAIVLDQKTLRDKVRNCLYVRTNWRSVLSYKLSGD